MRFSTSALVAALPVVASAQEALINQYTASFNNLVDRIGSIGSIGSYIPSPSTHDPVAAAEAKLGEMKLSVLTLDNWKETLYEPVPSDAVLPVEWWVLISGRNKTCFGRCDRIDGAFNQTAAKFAVLPGSPYMAYLNCDDQPVLCSIWSAVPTNIWSIQMKPEPAAIDIYRRRFNATTVTSDDIVAAKDENREKAWLPVDGWFHPFNGKIAELGLGLPVGYVLWVFSVVPSWATMLILSMVSRSMMSSRMQQMANPAPRQGQQGQR
jgi:hypothetical protein